MDNFTGGMQYLNPHRQHMKQVKYPYRKIIEENFLIDEPKSGKLVPFKFRPVQIRYYNSLCDKYDIENKGISTPIRDIILKARREGFSSLILALFACDDMIQESPTETLVISYRDDATETFRKRYRVFVLSGSARHFGIPTDAIQNDPNVLDIVAKEVFSVDSSDIELRHNKAHFYCGTASARVGGRGGVLQKLLFSEEAHYPDSENMNATEIIDGTLRQVDIESGWVFRESTANGYGNYYEKTWALAEEGKSRFRSCFFGWREMYSQTEYDLIASEFTDKKLLKQEYPDIPADAFISTGSGYFDNTMVMELMRNESLPPIAEGEMVLKCNCMIPCRILTSCPSLSYEFVARNDGRVKIWEYPKPGGSYVAGGDVAEGVEGDSSVLRVKNNQTLKPALTFDSNTTPPDEYALIVYAIGMWYNNAYIGVESNKDGLWVNDTLLKLGYNNLYFREQFDDVSKTVSKKVGFKTDERTRPYILSELLSSVTNLRGIWLDKKFLEECLVFVRGKRGKPEAMQGKHDDHIISEAIAFEIRRNAPQTTQTTMAPQNKSEEIVLARLQELKRQKQGSSLINQKKYI